MTGYTSDSTCALPFAFGAALFFCASGLVFHRFWRGISQFTSQHRLVMTRLASCMHCWTLSYPSSLNTLIFQNKLKFTSQGVELTSWTSSGLTFRFFRSARLSRGFLFAVLGFDVALLFFGDMMSFCLRKVWKRMRKLLLS